MKRFLLFVSMLFISLGVFAQYVDLGLPSGTKWKSFNEPGFYSYEEAISKFTDQLPTYDQLGELYGVCDWIWLGSAYKVIGPNGNFIKFPAAGYRDCNGSVNSVGSSGYYWSSSSSGSDYAYYLYVNSGKVFMYSYDRCYGHSVRLVQD
jgi:uncharacterized protein (TIGR02145 family)